MIGFCEYGNGNWGSISSKEFLDLRKDYQILIGLVLGGKYKIYNLTRPTLKFIHFVFKEIQKCMYWWIMNENT